MNTLLKLVLPVTNRQPLAQEVRNWPFMMKEALLDLLDASHSSSMSPNLQAPATLQVLLSIHSSESAGKAANLARVALTRAVGMEADDPESVIWLNHLPKQADVSERYASAL